MSSDKHGVHTDPTQYRLTHDTLKHSLPKPPFFLYIYMCHSLNPRGFKWRMSLEQLTTYATTVINLVMSPVVCRIKVSLINWFLACTLSYVTMPILCSSSSSPALVCLSRCLCSVYSSPPIFPARKSSSSFCS